MPLRRRLLPWASPAVFPPPCAATAQDRRLVPSLPAWLSPPHANRRQPGMAPHVSASFLRAAFPLLAVSLPRAASLHCAAVQAGRPCSWGSAGAAGWWESRDRSFLSPRRYWALFGCVVSWVAFDPACFRPVKSNSRIRWQASCNFRLCAVSGSPGAPHTRSCCHYPMHTPPSRLPFFCDSGAWIHSVTPRFRRSPHRGFRARPPRNSFSCH